MTYLFPPVAVTTLMTQDSDSLFPVRRIFCVGRNYADHAREMGAHDQAEGKEPPFFFTKPADALIGGAGQIAIPYPPATQDLQHEVELVAALGKGGSNIPVTGALDCVVAYTVGLDLTRRDMQARAKAKAHPWDMSKGFDASAVAGPLRLASQCGHPGKGAIWLKVNGETRQQGDLSQMSWSVAGVIAQLSRLVRLAPGDLIYTGTPAGVGTLRSGDLVTAGIDGVGELSGKIGIAPSV
ncbi:MAG: hypothetical protein RIR00_2664 [Pseudomonadota bacterium]|jgi:fumarylpyruvate hydrolase